MTTTNKIEQPKPVLSDAALYLGDNGRCTCGAHAGMSARFTGRDLSGQKVMKVTAAVVAESMAMFGEAVFKCEQQGCKVRVKG